MSTETRSIDLEDVRNKLYQYLVPSGWANKLKVFLMSQDFLDLLKKLADQSARGERFTPPVANMFRAFKECPYDKLKVVIVGQDPYPNKNVADGIAFSCGITQKSQPSLRYIYREIRETVPGYSEKMWFTHDLSHWSNQGILLLNSALTVTIDKPGTHFDLWKPFMVFLMDILATSNSGLVYAFLGKKAQEYMSLVPEGNKVFRAIHPVAASYNNERSWDSDDLFNKIDEEMMRLYGEKIAW